MKIKYDINLMKFMSLFESLTRAKLKDCFDVNETLVFVVDEGEIGKAIGKHAVNVKRIESMIKKKIRIIEFNPVMLEFVKSVVYPLQLKDLREEEGVVMMAAVDSNTRGLLIGRSAQNLRFFESIIKRFFDVKELKVA